METLNEMIAECRALLAHPSGPQTWNGVRALLDGPAREMGDDDLKALTSYVEGYVRRWPKESERWVTNLSWFGDPRHPAHAIVDALRLVGTHDERVVMEALPKRVLGGVRALYLSGSEVRAGDLLAMMLKLSGLRVLDVGLCIDGDVGLGAAVAGGQRLEQLIFASETLTEADAKELLERLPRACAGVASGADFTLRKEAGGLFAT